MNPRWRPYAVGAGIGVLSWVAFAVLNHPIGISTSVSALSGECLRPFLGDAGVSANPYWKKTPWKIDYGALFVLGTFLGAGVSALAGGSFRTGMVPAVWKQAFGGAVWKRGVGAFVGGALVMFGARLAGGCTSGHGISGSLQLALSSWVFFGALFASGILTARLLFRGGP